MKKRFVWVMLFIAFCLSTTLVVAGSDQDEAPPLETVVAEQGTVGGSLEQDPPVDNPPADNPPADNPPADNPPADNLPADDLPVDNPPVDDPPVDDPPADNSPTDDPPVDDPSERGTKEVLKQAGLELTPTGDDNLKVSVYRTFKRISSDEYEKQFGKVEDAFRVSEEETAVLEAYSGRLKMQGEDNLQNLVDQWKSTGKHLFVVIENNKSLVRKGEEEKMAKLLAEHNKLNGYNFGQNLPEYIDIPFVPGRGTGEVDVSLDDNVVWTIHFARVPGPEGVVQNVKFVIATPKLSGKHYAQYEGILFEGQTKVRIFRKPLVYTLKGVDVFLKYNRTCEAQLGWLKCAEKSCVPFAEQ